MAFGLGKKKEAAAPAAQMSPEAMAMLTEMAQGQGQQAAPMAPAMPPAGATPEAQAQMPGQIPGQMPGQMPASAGAPMLDQTNSVAGAGSANSNLTKKEQRRLAREQKKASAQAAKEEKARQRRAKKGAKSRFSRARYLREANGNAATGVALSSLLVLLTLFGPILLNALFLLPQTSENREIASRVQSYNDIISQAAPLLQVAVKNKADREAEIQSRINNFKNAETVTAELRQFIADLEGRGASFSSEASRTVTNSDVGVAGLAGKTLTMDMEADFLSYLLVRNKLARAQPSIDVTTEEIVATLGDPIVAIKLVLTVPAQQ